MNATPLTPREQKRIVRSTAIAQGRIDRINENLDCGIYNSQADADAARALRDELRAKVRNNVATLQARGTPIARRPLAAEGEAEGG